MFSRTLAVTALAGLVLMAMPAHAQTAGSSAAPILSTPTTLYFHINGFQDFPINTQKPDDRYADQVKVGLTTHSTSCIDSTTEPIKENYHTLYGYSSPSYVEYNVQEDGKPRIHQERGISYDAQLDTSAPAFLYWYIETTQGLGATTPDLNAIPVVVPMVSVQATVRTGSAVDVSKDSLNTGDVIARGKVTGMLAADATDALTQQVTTLGGSFPAGAEVKYLSKVDGTSHQVYMYKIPLSYEGNGVIPRATGYNIRIDAFLDNPVCPDPSSKYLMPNVIAVHTSKDNRPRVELAVMNPLRIEYLHPEFVGDDLVVHTASNAVWGNYDVDESGPFSPSQDGQGILVAIDGPSPPPSSKVNQVAIVQDYHGHFHHQDAVAITYLWKYKEDAPQDGVYTVKMTIKNDQRTATAVGEAKFQIGKGDLPPCPKGQQPSQQFNCVVTNTDDGKKDSPSAGILVVVGLLAIAMLARRRQ